MILTCQQFDTPRASEVIAWLRGDYPYVPECMTE